MNYSHPIFILHFLTDLHFRDNLQNLWGEKGFYDTLIVPLIYQKIINMCHNLLISIVGYLAAPVDSVRVLSKQLDPFAI